MRTGKPLWNWKLGMLGVSIGSPRPCIGLMAPPELDVPLLNG